MTGPTTCLGIDLGASSGRVMAGWVNDSGHMELLEIHRFANQPVRGADSLTWNFDELMKEIQTGLRLGIEQGRSANRPVVSIGVDSWAVDFGLVDDRGNLVSPVYHYRDVRNHGQMEKVFAKIPRTEVFRRSGIQFLPFNTIYQLSAIREQHPEWLNQARHFMMIADLVAWKLTGVVSCEYTNATTTQLFDPVSGEWSSELLESLDIPGSIFPEVVQPGSVIGSLLPELSAEWNAGIIQVIAVATHDTGSAVAAVPAAKEKFAYLSSGTWSLLGTEIKEPNLSATALEANFTNEGGACGTFRFLKNIVGLWIMQECMRHWKIEGNTYDWAAVEIMAEESDFEFTMDVDDPRFLAPQNMPAEIRGWFEERGQQSPETDGDLVRCVLRSLAKCYAQKLDLLEEICGLHFEELYIVGGGSQNRLLCKWTAEAIKRPVLAGPAEATVIGNIGIQMMSSAAVCDLQQLRDMVKRSFPIKQYQVKLQTSGER